jgi:RNA polymerase sigma-70 factor (ECF subfamily)
MRVVPPGTLAVSKPSEANDMPDPQAVRLAQQGDPAAFEHLYRKHSQRVYALCLRMMANSAAAEDLTQEAFLQVFRKIHTFRGDSAFSTWLHRLSVNVVLMRLRKKTVNETPLEDSDREEEFGKLRKEIGAPDLRLAGTIDRMRLEHAIAQLPPGYKQAFVLHDIQGYQHKEIAAILGCSAGNSKSQLHKARMRLRQLLHGTGRDNWRKKSTPSRTRLARSLRDLRSSPICGADFVCCTSVPIK